MKFGIADIITLEVISASPLGMLYFLCFHLSFLWSLFCAGPEKLRRIKSERERGVFVKKETSRSQFSLNNTTNSNAVIKMFIFIPYFLFLSSSSSLKTGKPIWRSHQIGLMLKEIGVYDSPAYYPERTCNEHLFLRWSFWVLNLFRIVYNKHILFIYTLPFMNQLKRKNRAHIEYKQL